MNDCLPYNEGAARAGPAPMRPPDRSTATAPRPCVTLASTPPRRRVIRLLEQRCRWLCPTPGGWRRRTGAARTPPPARAGRQARAGQGPRARAAARRADDHACRGRAWRGLQARRSPGRYPAVDSVAADDASRADGRGGWRRVICLVGELARGRREREEGRPHEALPHGLLLPADARTRTA